MTTKHAGKAGTVEDAVARAVQGTGNVAKATADAVSEVMSTTLKDAGKVGVTAADSVGQVAGAAIAGASGVGGHLGHAAKGAVVGVLRGTKHVSTDA